MGMNNVRDARRRKNKVIHKQNLYIDSLAYRSVCGYFMGDWSHLPQSDENISIPRYTKYVMRALMILLIIFFIGMMIHNERRWQRILEHGFDS